MGSILCKTYISESAIVLLKTSGQSTGTVSIHSFVQPSYVGPQINMQLTTDCPYLTIPSGNYPIGIISSPNENIFAYDLSGYAGYGVELCGHITVDTDEEGCASTIEIPVYVWSVKNDDDIMEVCGAIMPSSIHVDVDDPSTHEQFFPIIRSQDPGTLGANSALGSNGCPYAQIDEVGAQGPNGGADYQLNYVGEAVVYPVEFDVSDYEGCGENIHVCTFTAYQSYQLAGPPIECEQPVNVYFTSQCRERDCPISWGTSDQTISKNAGNTGSFFAPLINEQNYAVSVQITTDCPYLVVPEDPVELGALESGQVEISYDLTDYTLCGDNACGSVTATVEYLEVEGCARTFDVSIGYECVVEEGDDYITRLYDDNGNQTVSINSDCSLITIMDNSVWGQFGHAISDFSDYRRITITHQQSGEQYVMSSLYPDDGSDELINPAASGDLTFTYATNQYGVFEVVLCNVPTWGPGYQYQANDDVVWHNGKLYAAIDPSQGVNPETSPNATDNWVEITYDQIDQYTDKYCDTQIVLSSCNLDQCMATKYRDVACLTTCNFLELCKDEDLFNLFMLDYLITYLDEAINENDMQAATHIYDLAAKICKC